MAPAREYIIETAPCRRNVCRRTFTLPKLPTSDRMKNYRSALTSFAVAAALVVGAAAHAIPVTDVHVEDLMSQASDVKKSLNLNPNQQLLWQQTESKMRAILSARQRRREQLQTDLKKGLDDPHAELRDLAKRMETEDDLSYQENKQLRELWLTVNDALDDPQRETILTLLSDQLQRIPDQGCETKADQQPHMHTGRQKTPGMNNALPQ
jgi:hypothetical protein